MRSGQPRIRPAAELVPGDVVRLEAGDVVPADLVFVQAAARCAAATPPLIRPDKGGAMRAVVVYPGTNVGLSAAAGDAGPAHALDRRATWAALPAGGPARLIETHTSVLVFLGDRVYKVKKAADLGFLDFRTLAARAAACRAEVELNRRLAPDVYLGVADVLGPDGQPCDHLVVMRRMPEERRLATLVRHGVAAGDALRALARLLAGFHARCPTSAEIARAGDPQAIRGLWQEGIDALQGFRGRILDADTVDEIEQLALRYLAGRGTLLRERQRAGRIRDGHGDLLAEDIFCLDDGPRVLDCLEFAPRLRFGDVLGDVAFLVMDLERLGAPELATAFLDWYREFSDETHPTSLEHLYVAYRTFVRCKVACLRSDQGDPDAAGEARRLARICRDHLRQTRVRLVLVGGLPGTGKSTLAAALLADRDATLLRSDVLRKELVGLPPGQSAAAAVGKGVYREEMSARTYTELLRRARAALQRGQSVVLDASWSSAGRRADAARVAAETASDLVELQCTAPREVALDRIRRRTAIGNDASDAGIRRDGGSDRPVADSCRDLHRQRTRRRGAGRPRCAHLTRHGHRRPSPGNRLGRRGRPNPCRRGSAWMRRRSTAGRDCHACEPAPLVRQRASYRRRSRAARALGPVGGLGRRRILRASPRRWPCQPGPGPP